MRITREMLVKLARDTVTQRLRADPGLLAVYVHGSLLTDAPLLGGTADVDLFFIHNDDIEVEREIVRVTEEVHLDIAHHPRKLYRQPKALRLQPWLGTTIFGCQILHDPQHFMAFTQASVRGQFDRPDHVLERSRPLADQARQIWLSYSMGLPQPGIEAVSLYLQAIEKAANAIALLSGAPLTERRFLLQFPQRAQAIGHPGLYAGLLGLLGGPVTDQAVLGIWLTAWRAAYEALPDSKRPARYHRHRLAYFERALQAMLESDTPQTALWPMMHIWSDVVSNLGDDPEHLAPWQEAGKYLGWLGAGFTERLAALDAYLDTIEETLDDWGRASGV